MGETNKFLRIGNTLINTDSIETVSHIVDTIFIEMKDGKMKTFHVSNASEVWNTIMRTLNGNK